MLGELPIGEVDAEGTDIIYRMASELADGAAARIGASRDNFLRRLKGVRVLNTPTVNGNAVSADNWSTFEIEIYSGLMTFIHKAYKLVVSQLPTADSPNSIPVYPRVNLLTVQTIGHDLVDAFWEGQPLAVTGLPITALTDGQRSLNAELVHYAEQFIVGHEVGHFIQKANPNPRLFVFLNIEDDETKKRKWNEEVNADALGLLLATEANKERAGLVINAVQLFFSIQDILEDAYKRQIGKPLPSDTHPPAALRLHLLREFAQKSKSALQYGSYLEEKARDVFQT